MVNWLLTGYIDIVWYTIVTILSVWYRTSLLELLSGPMVVVSLLPLLPYGLVGTSCNSCLIVGVESVTDFVNGLAGIYTRPVQSQNVYL